MRTRTAGVKRVLRSRARVDVLSGQRYSSSWAPTVTYTFERGTQSPLQVHLPDPKNLSGAHKDSRHEGWQAQCVQSKGVADGTSLNVWPAARVLSQYLVTNADRLPAAPYVELGCGLGLCGVTLAKLLAENEGNAAAGTAPRMNTKAIVYCTDGDPEALSLLPSSAALNGVSEFIDCVLMEYGNRDQARSLLELVNAGEPPRNEVLMATSASEHRHGAAVSQHRPGLVIASDVLYDLQAIEPLVETLWLLGAPLSLLSFAPRHLDADFAGSQEIEVLIEVAKRRGFNIRRRLTHGPADRLWDSVIVMALERHSLQG